MISPNMWKLKSKCVNLAKSTAYIHVEYKNGESSNVNAMALGGSQWISVAHAFNNVEQITVLVEPVAKQVTSNKFNIKFKEIKVIRDINRDVIILDLCMIPITTGLRRLIPDKPFALKSGGYLSNRDVDGCHKTLEAHSMKIGEDAT